MACGSSLFGQNQYIKINGGDFIVVEGSSMRDKLPLSDLRIPYKQILKSRIILKKGQINYLLNHLGLGDNATFLTIKAIYDPKSVIESDNYINYSYYNYPVSTFTFAQLLVLTGNSSNRIPQLYLNNPNTKYPVVLEVLVGVIDDSDSFFNDINQSSTSFTGLEYTDIKTFVVGESIVINDKNIKPLIFIYISNINSIERSDNFLIIDDGSYGTIFLSFLTEYDAIQSQSLLNYIIQNPTIDINNLSPISDDESPIIYFNSTAGLTGSYIDFNGSTSSVPYDTTYGYTFSTSISLSTYGTSGYLDKNTLIDLLIYNISDNRDGDISLSTSNLIISDTYSDMETISGVGTYSVTFTLSDSAQNEINSIINLNIIN